MPSVTGRVFISLNGQRIRSRAGATLDTGGLTRTAAMSDAGVDGFSANPAAREAIAVDALRAIELAGLEGGGPADAVRPSMLKVLGTEASQRIDLLALEIAAGWVGDIDDAPDAIAIAMPKYLNNRASTIYAGSNEIQRDLIARVVVDQAA